MKKGNRSKGLILSFFLFISAILSVLVIPLPIAKAAPTYSWSTFTVAESGDDVELLAYTGWSNFTTDGDNLWVHSDEYTTYAFLRFEGLGAITNAGGVIDQIILSMYSGVDVGEDYEESPYAGYVSVSCPYYGWNIELTEENILAISMNPVASFDGDYLSPSGAWYNKTISNSDPRDWYAWGSNFNDVFICSVTGFMQYSPDWTYYRSFTSFDEGHPAKLYVKYHTGEGYEEVLDYFGVDYATYNQSWNNYNIWQIPGESEAGYPLDPMEYVFTYINDPSYDTIHSLPGTGVVIEDADDVTATGYAYQRKLVRENNGTLHATYIKDLAAKSQVYVKKSLDNGTNWIDATRISTYDGMSTYDQGRPGMAIDSNDNLHVTWDGKATNYTTNTQIWYNKYDHETEVWSGPEQVGNYSDMNVTAQARPTIIVDADDTPHIVWHGSVTGLATMVWISNYTTGWSTPIIVSNSTDMVGRTQGEASITVDSNNILHAAWRGTHTDHAVNAQIWYANYTDSSWSEPEYISTTGSAWLNTVPCIVVDSLDNLHVTWRGKSGGFPLKYGVYYSNYTEPVWSAPISLSEDYLDMDDFDQDEGTLAVDSDDDIHFIWQGESTGTDFVHGWYRYLDNETKIWSGTENIQDTQCRRPNLRWARYPEYTLAGNDTFVGTAPNGTVITPDPFETPEEVLEFIQDWDEDYGPVLAISIANIDAGEWVFEGKKRYEFTVVYINVNLTDIEQVGVGFTDETNHFHSVWYDRDANTLTVTSPEDGISGWLHSIDQTDTNVTAVFHIMFNSPIPDSYDVSAYGRIVDTTDSGWVTPKWGEAGESGELYLFNIYNLGGLSTLTKSGTAGRVTGGDIFEIYASDTRTNIAGTEYFDVRDSPLSWYNVLTNEDDLINEMPPDWEFHIPRRTQSVTIRLTNNLPEDRDFPQARNYVSPATDDLAYVSYPFSMRLLSDPFLSGVYQVSSELTFPRNLTSNDGILWVQAYLMTPNTTTTTGAFWVRDGSRLVSGTKILSGVQFNGNGSWASLNSSAPAPGWIYYSSYDAYTWYNVTMALNLTAAVYDIFIDDVEVVSDLPYRIPTATNAYVVEFTQQIPVAGAPDDAFLDFYVDNVRQWTDFDADYGGIAEATMLFKQLQHWSMDFDFFVENGKEYAQGPTATPALDSDDYSDHGYVELGWDIMLNETWVNDYLVARVNITDGKISGKNDWVKFNVTWYNQGVRVKNDLLYGLFEGYSLFPGSSKDTSGFHWDIWFNRANASTVLGARINTEYFGMSDKSVWWAVWSSKWQPMRTEVSDSTIFVDLDDANATIQSAKAVLFVRSWVKVLRTSESTFAYKILNIGGLNFLVAIETMSGIDTPPVRETKIPDVISGFLGSSLGSIFSAALKRLGNTLAGFGMGFFTMSIDFIDNIFAALGYPALVSTIFGWMDSLFGSVPTLVGYGITMIGQVFNLINTSAGDTLTQLTSIITIWVGMYSTTMDFLSGVLTPGFNLWNDLGISSFIQVGAIMYPLWLLILASEKGVQAVIDHLTGILNIGSFFLNFILNVGGFFMSLLTGLIGAIRG